LPALSLVKAIRCINRGAASRSSPIHGRTLHWRVFVPERAAATGTLAATEVYR
jgi:hypothetical protein